jgi:hypothetical protein
MDYDWPTGQVVCMILRLFARGVEPHDLFVLWCRSKQDSPCSSGTYACDAAVQSFLQQPSSDSALEDLLAGSLQSIVLHVACGCRWQFAVISFEHMIVVSVVAGVVVVLVSFRELMVAC